VTNSKVWMSDVGFAGQGIQATGINHGGPTDREVTQEILFIGSQVYSPPNDGWCINLNAGGRSAAVVRATIANNQLTVSPGSTAGGIDLAGGTATPACTILQANLVRGTNFNPAIKCEPAAGNSPSDCMYLANMLLACTIQGGSPHVAPLALYGLRHLIAFNKGVACSAPFMARTDPSCLVFGNMPG